MQRARAYGFNYDTHTHTHKVHSCIASALCECIAVVGCVGAAPVLVCVEKNLRNMFKHKQDDLFKQQKE